jgi:hypothetical protein
MTAAGPRPGENHLDYIRRYERDRLLQKARDAAAFDLEYMREYKRLTAEQGVKDEPPPGRPSDRHLKPRASGSDSDLDRR